MAKDNKKDNDKKNGKSSKMIIILIIVIVLLVVGGAGYYFLVLSKKGATQANANTAKQNSTGIDADEQTYSFNDITTNLADKDSQRFIKVSVALGYDPKVYKKLQGELENKTDIKTPILRAAIVEVLRNKTSADFADDKKISQIETEILNKINPHLQDGKVSNVYFSDLVIQ